MKMRLNGLIGVALILLTASCRKEKGPELEGVQWDRVSRTVEIFDSSNRSQSKITTDESNDGFDTFKEMQWIMHREDGSINLFLRYVRQGNTIYLQSPSTQQYTIDVLTDHTLQLTTTLEYEDFKAGVLVPMHSVTQLTFSR